MVDKKDDKVKFDNIPKTNEEYISVTYGCLRFIDSYRFLWSSLDSLVKTSVIDDYEILKNEFPDKWDYLNEKLVYPYEFFSSIDDYEKQVDNLKKEDFFSKLKNACPNAEKIERTREIMEKFDNKNREE